MRPTKRRARGFTLIELIIVVIVIGIMAAALAPMMLSSVTAYNTIQDNVVVLDKQRYALERLAREIREVNYDATAGFAFSTEGTCIGGMCNNEMNFTRAFDNAVGPPTETTVTVGNTGSAVTLAYTGVAAQVLTDELGPSGTPPYTGSLVFAYLDKNGCVTGNNTPPCTGGTVDAGNVRSVRITLTLSHNGKPYTQSTQVELKRFAAS